MPHDPRFILDDKLLIWSSFAGEVSVVLKTPLKPTKQAKKPQTQTKNDNKKTQQNTNQKTRLKASII